MGENETAPRTIYDTDKFVMKEIVPLNLKDGEPMEEVPQIVRPLTGEGAEFVMKTAPVIPPKMIENFFMNYIRIFSFSLRALVEIKVEHPKWIHLYRQAKKYRTRKKYARKIDREIMTKVKAYTEREAAQCQPQN